MRVLSKTDLIRAGEVLYGERWRTPIAADLHVSYRTLCCWLAGTSNIPVAKLATLQEIVKARIAKLQRVSEFLAEGYRGYAVPQTTTPVLSTEEQSNVHRI